MSTTNPPEFQIGLCLAGAVSAGAYTAGVMDYLIEALDNWESQRNMPGVPQHRVKIPVIGGASAGGMTGILAASAINNPITPIKKISTLIPYEKHPENKFWHTWVDLKTDDMFPLMLDTSDIKPAGVLSLFNSSFIKDIADRFIAVDPSRWILRPYFHENLKVFTTLTSLKGLSFNIEFLGSGIGRDKYCITRHNDYACFKLNTTTYNNDGWIPLDFKSGEAVRLAAQAAMATGAFPVGLQSRHVQRESRYVNDNEWLKDLTLINPVLEENYTSLNVDGGMINNEPFEKVRDVLSEITGQSDHDAYNDYNRFTSTILMVDPFPSEPPEYDDSNMLFQVMSSTLSALISQVRIKPENLVDAVKSDLAGQYLISPSRDMIAADGTTKEVMGSKAIACGAFGGFSGFFNKEFRMHDYFLGRANCEKFLRDHFTVPANSTNVITQGYASLTEQQKTQFYSTTGNGVKQLPIIPVLAPRSAHKYMPVFSSGTDWPVVNEKVISIFKKNLQKRIGKLIMNLVDYSKFMKFFLWLGVPVLKRRLANASLKYIKQSLADHALLHSPHFKPAKQRKQSELPIPNMDTTVHWLMKVAESTAADHDFTFVPNCYDTLQQAITKTLSAMPDLKNFRSDETKSEMHDNVRTFVRQMIDVAQKNNMTALHENTFYAVRSTLCPLPPIC